MEKTQRMTESQAAWAVRDSVGFFTGVKYLLL